MGATSRNQVAPYFTAPVATNCLDVPRPQLSTIELASIRLTVSSAGVKELVGQVRQYVPGTHGEPINGPMAMTRLGDGAQGVSGDGDLRVAEHGMVIGDTEAWPD
jgi:hypothetical protein